MDVPRDLVETLTGFARTLRAAGVNADPERLQAMIGALDRLDVRNPRDVYWAGRLTLCADPADLPRYDRCFAAYFSGETASVRRAPRRPVPVARPAAGSEAAGAEGGGDPSGTAASAAEILRRRDVARLSTAERDEVRRLVALLDNVSARRRSRRFAPASRGRVDAARTVRAILRRGGEISRPHHRAHRTRPRRVVLLIDVSGSMSPYADVLLRFAHAALRCAPRSTEVFTVGTRLTRVTRELRHREPDAAMAAVSSAIPDWSGGTRLGEELKEFLDWFGQRGMARGAVVVVASDGWERGDATLLRAQMARLRRLAHRVVWANPHKARPGYEPLTAGMAAALPHVDDFVAGHSLAALEELAGVIGDA
ncbi:vWA domain-containing protein [Actinoallomurus rhizosphaericola]|uniref:vWA domain-containing protein n=1 Tax=Actinoallomurus rhizosphaericola TaxID=2952536 RepID=UPI002092C099|nr:VWA domain-containing protein [Actinoallomurus rhizosphaericola]MCO5996596.1 VWA domain-containing protein [Actinoallomurus rhizosphaericola]